MKQFDTIHVERYESGGYRVAVNPESAGVKVRHFNAEELVNWIAEKAGLPVRYLRIAETPPAPEDEDDKVQLFDAAVTSSEPGLSPAFSFGPPKDTMGYDHGPEDESLTDYVDRRLAEQQCKIVEGLGSDINAVSARLDKITSRVGELDNQAAGESSRAIGDEEGPAYYYNPFVRSRELDSELTSRLDALTEKINARNWQEAEAYEHLVKRLTALEERIGNPNERNSVHALIRNLREDHAALRGDYGKRYESRLRALEAAAPSLEHRTTSSAGDAKLAKELSDLRDAFNRYADDTAIQIQTLKDRLPAPDSLQGLRCGQSELAERIHYLEGCAKRGVEFRNDFAERLQVAEGKVKSWVESMRVSIPALTDRVKVAESNLSTMGQEAYTRISTLEKLQSIAEKGFHAHRDRVEEWMEKTAGRLQVMEEKQAMTEAGTVAYRNRIERRFENLAEILPEPNIRGD